MKKTDDIAALFQGSMNAKMPCYAAAGVNVDWFGRSVNSRMLCRLSYWGTEVSVPPVCGFREAENELELGAYTEYGDRMREAERQ